MIPKDRPVVGYDFEVLRQKLSLSTMNMAFLLGISITEWTKLIKHKTEIPVMDKPLEIIARFLDENPEACFIPAFPQPADLYKTLSSDSDYSPRSADKAKKGRRGKGSDDSGLSKKYFAVAAGRQGSGGYRWTELQGRGNAKLDRVLFLMLWNYAQAKTPQEKLRARMKWDAMIQQIGRIHGIPDVLAAGKWTKDRPAPEGQAPKSKPRAKAAKTAKR